MAFTEKNIYIWEMVITFRSKTYLNIKWILIEWSEKRKTNMRGSKDNLT